MTAGGRCGKAADCNELVADFQYGDSVCSGEQILTTVISIFAAMAVSAMPFETGNPSLQYARVTCKQVSSCDEAVQIWCNGYRRADGDSDGIPCENVCNTVEQVNEIRQQQGC